MTVFNAPRSLVQRGDRWRAVDRELTRRAEAATPQVRRMFRGEGRAIDEILKQTGALGLDVALEAVSVEEWTKVLERLWISNGEEVFGQTWDQIEERTSKARRPKLSDFPEFLAEARQTIVDRAEAIVENTRRRITETARRAAGSVAEGFGEVMRTEISGLYTNWDAGRSGAIARHNVLTATAHAQHSAARASGAVLVKEWVSMQDDRVRPAHASADGQLRDLEAPYSVGGEDLRYPRDPAGSIGNTANCRCQEIYQPKPPDFPEPSEPVLEPPPDSPEDATPAPVPRNRPDPGNLPAYRRKINALREQFGSGFNRDAIREFADRSDPRGFWRRVSGAPGPEMERLLDIQLDIGRSVDDEIKRRLRAADIKHPKTLRSIRDKARAAYESKWEDFEEASARFIDETGRRPLPADRFRLIGEDSRDLFAPFNDELEQINRELDELQEAWGKASHDYSDGLHAYSRRYSEEVRSILSEVREFGGEPLLSNVDLVDADELRGYLGRGSETYPRDWLEASNQRGALNLKRMDRAHYRHSDAEFGISGTGDSAISTARHELAHRMEEIVEGIRESEWTFYRRRTNADQSLDFLSTQEPILRLDATSPGYRAAEIYREDKFVDPYMGKTYALGDYSRAISDGLIDRTLAVFGAVDESEAAWELFSTGVQGLFDGSFRMVTDDPDMTRWIIGVFLTL